MKNKRVCDIKKLFHPESKFYGTVSKILKAYPQRSSHLEEIAKNKEKIKMIIDFNEGSSQLDEFLIEVQRELMQQDKIDHSSDNDIQNNLSTSNTRKIAIITDVHALYEPLEAVLKDIKSRGINEIYSLGDNIGLGPNPKEVMDLLEEYNVVSIAGNNEEYINLSTASFYYFDYKKEASNAWTKSKLTPPQIEKLLLYPKFIEFTMGGKEIALCHFANDIRCDYDIRSTWSYQRNPMGNYKQFYYTNSEAQLKEIAAILGFPFYDKYEKESTSMQLQILKEYVKNKTIPDYLKGFESYIQNPLFFSNDILKTVNDYDAIIQGHVHFESHVETDKTSFHTLRAVGMGNIDGRDDLATYTIIHEAKDGYKLEKVEVPFDKEKTEHIIKKTKFPKEMITRYLNVR